MAIDLTIKIVTITIILISNWLTTTTNNHHLSTYFIHSHIYACVNAFISMYSCFILFLFSL